MTSEREWVTLGYCFVVAAIMLRVAMRYFDVFVASPGHGAYFAIGYTLTWLLLGIVGIYSSFPPPAKGD